MNAGEAASNWRDSIQSRQSKSGNTKHKNDLDRSFREEDEGAEDEYGTEEYGENNES